MLGGLKTAANCRNTGGTKPLVMSASHVASLRQAAVERFK
jgi:hypothetical protein